MQSIPVACVACVQWFMRGPTCGRKTVQYYEYNYFPPHRKQRTQSENLPRSTFIRDEMGTSPSPPNTRFAETFLATKDGFMAIVRSTTLKGNDVATLLNLQSTYLRKVFKPAWNHQHVWSRCPFTVTRCEVFKMRNIKIHFV
jgi:hypothetical protein